MPGVPGVSTHVPKRAAERRRTNSKPVDTISAAGEVFIPELPATVHPLARQWYDSLKVSGQSQYYESSDWIQAVVTAEALTRWLAMDVPSAGLFASILNGFDALLTTEGARRRARIEVERVRPTAAGAKPSNVTDYRARLVNGGRRNGGAQA